MSDKRVCTEMFQYTRGSLRHPLPERLHECYFVSGLRQGNISIPTPEPNVCKLSTGVIQPNKLSLKVV
jgi:hypothetical protein